MVAEQAIEPAKQVGLGFKGNDAGAQAGKSGAAVTEMGADIESQVARPEELAIQPTQATLAAGTPINDQRSGETDAAPASGLPRL
ncbi:hypothetical protein GCM10008094_28260 [Aidingimonas halophila]|nr:hypothetical protein GCM10008094_28260 [Aidingimonas halophila]